MEWIIEPLAGFQAIDLVADTCSGSGTTLNSCSTKGSLIECSCSGGLKVSPQSE